MNERLKHPVDNEIHDPETEPEMMVGEPKLFPYVTKEAMIQRYQESVKEKQNLIAKYQQKLKLIENGSLSEQSSKRAGLTTLNLSEYADMFAPVKPNDFLVDNSYANYAHYMTEEDYQKNMTVDNLRNALVSQIHFEENEITRLESLIEFDPTFVDLKEITAQQEQQVAQGNGAQVFADLGFRKFYKMLKAFRYSAFIENAHRRLSELQSRPQLAQAEQSLKEEAFGWIQGKLDKMQDTTENHQKMEAECVTNQDIREGRAIRSDQDISKFCIRWESVKKYYTGRTDPTFRFYISPPSWLHLEVFKTLVKELDDAIKETPQKDRFLINAVFHKVYFPIRTPDAIIVYVTPDVDMRNSQEDLEQGFIGIDMAAKAIAKTAQHYSEELFNSVPENFRGLIETQYQSEALLSRVAEGMIPLDTNLDIACVEHTGEASYRSGEVEDQYWRLRPEANTISKMIESPFHYLFNSGNDFSQPHWLERLGKLSTTQTSLENKVVNSTNKDNRKSIRGNNLNMPALMTYSSDVIT